MDDKAATLADLAASYRASHRRELSPIDSARAWCGSWGPGSGADVRLHDPGPSDPVRHRRPGPTSRGLQEALGGGPGATAFSSGERVPAHIGAGDPRWPQFEQAARVAFGPLTVEAIRSTRPGWCPGSSPATTTSTWTSRWRRDRCSSSSTPSAEPCSPQHRRRTRRRRGRGRAGPRTTRPPAWSWPGSTPSPSMRWRSSARTPSPVTRPSSRSPTPSRAGRSTSAGRPPRTPLNPATGRSSSRPRACSPTSSTSTRRRPSRPCAGSPNRPAQAVRGGRPGRAGGRLGAELVGRKRARDGVTRDRPARAGP